MGRYLTIVDQRFEIKAENVDAAYRAAIAPFVEDGSMLCWAEGYYDMWSMWFLNGSVKDGPCEIVWSRPEAEAA